MSEAEKKEKRGFWLLLWRSWWLLPVLHMVLFWCGVGITLGMSLGAYRREWFVIAFGLFWSGRAVSLLLPVLVAVQLIRKQWRTAWATTWFSAAALALTACFEWWASKLPTPPHQTGGSLYDAVITVFFVLGVMSAAFLALVSIVQLSRRQRSQARTAALCPAVVLPPFLLLLCLMTETWPWFVWWLRRTTGVRLY